MNRRLVAGLLLAISFLIAVSNSIQAAEAQQFWPRWRGPAGDGHTAETKLPVSWDAAAITWKTQIEGRGESSPVIWGERIFLTTAREEGKSRVMLAVDRRTGKVIWEKSISFAGDIEKLHKMNSWATPSCVTDGSLVFAFFGRAGLHCFTVEGEKVWSKDIGHFESPWGVAACPVLLGDLVIQNGDADVDAFIAAYNKKTGEQVWRTTRPAHRGWSTPIIFNAGREELVVNGHAGTAGYDPKTGKELWFCKSFNGRGEPTATPGDGVVYMVNGLSGDIYAVRPGGDGDVTSSRMAWHTPRKSGRDLPSPILIGNFLLVSSMSGVCTCYDATSGSALWTERIGGNYSASPVAANGLAFFQVEDGDVVVIKPGPQLDQVARNTLSPGSDEIFRSSPAPLDGQWFLRSDKVLYCVGKRIEK